MGVEGHLTGRRSSNLFALLLLHSLDEERVVADLAQLHHHVHQAGDVLAHATLARDIRWRAACCAYSSTARTHLHEELAIAVEQRAVVLLLYGGQLDLDDRLLLGRDGLLDVLLEAAQEVGLEEFVQLPDLFLLSSE